MIEGVVLSFDENRGDGIVRDDAGRDFYFHCVRIADGSRVIEVGTAVRARRVVGLLGRDEASEVTKR